MAYTTSEKIQKLDEIIEILQEQLDEIKELNKKEPDDNVRRYIINPLDCVIETWDKYGFCLTKWKRELKGLNGEEEDEDEDEE